MSDIIDYLTLQERHHHDRQVGAGGFAGAVAEALAVAVAAAALPTPSALAFGLEGGSLSRIAASRIAASRIAVAEALAVAKALAVAVAEALAVAVAEVDGGLPTPSARSPSSAWGAVTALASRAAGEPSRVRVATETEAGRWSAERSS